MLPEGLKTRLQKVAEKEQLSFGKLVRQVLEKYLLSRGGAGSDSFLNSKTLFTDEGPQDVADKHDEYLFQREPR